MFWKLVFTRQYTWVNSPDIAAMVLPWFELQAASLHRWSLALWDPYQWCGQPLAAQGQAGVLYPLNWLLWAFPLHHSWLRHVYLNWYFVLIHFQAAVFAYWLCRDQSCSRSASILGGMAYAFGPFLDASTWPAALNAAVWAPLALMFFLRAVGQIRPKFSAAACGSALGACWLSGSDEVPAALCFAFAALWMWHAFRARGAARISLWKQPVLCAAAAIGVGAMQIFPALEYLPFRPHVWFTQAAATWHAHSLSPLNLVSIVMPGAGDSSLFIGWAALAFALIGAFAMKDPALASMSLFLGATGLAIAVGHFSMLSGALYSARLIWKDPHSALCLLALAIPIPAAAGLDALREGFTAPAVKRILLFASILGGAALLMLAMVSADDLDRLTPLALAVISALLTLVLLEAGQRRAISSRSIAVCAILLAMWQFGHVTGVEWRNIEFGWPWLNRLTELSDIAAIVRGQTQPVRFANPDGSAHFDAGDWHGVEQFDGLTGGTENIVGIADLPAARALAGTAFLIAPQGAEESAFHSVSGLKLYPQPNALPRAWVVNRVTAVHNRGEVRSRLSRGAQDGGMDYLRRNAFVTGEAPALGNCGDPGMANFTSRKGRRATVHVALPCTGLVVISQTFYPGWTAFVDGSPARMYEAYGFLDAVVAPAGQHTVELIYRPWSIWFGAAVTALTLVLLAFAYKRGDVRNRLARTGERDLTS